MLRPELADRAVKLKEIEDAQLRELSPKNKGGFSVKPLNTLVAEYNKIAPLFGIKDKYPMFSEAVFELPPDFMQVLMMVKAAVDDAIKAEVIPANLAFTVGDVKDDKGLLTLASKLKVLSGNRDFKDFLMSATEPVEQERFVGDDGGMESAPVEKPMTDEDFLGFISKRM